MYGIEFGVCKECQRSTPISVNTITENGLWCMHCRMAQFDEKRRTRPLDERIAQLEAELQQLYVTRAWFASAR